MVWNDIDTWTTAQRHLFLFVVCFVLPMLAVLAMARRNK